MAKQSKLKQHLNNHPMASIGYAAIAAIIIAPALLYLPRAIAARSLNYNKIIKHRDSVFELKIQNSYREQFHELDKNLDGVIDSTEFIYRKN